MASTGSNGGIFDGTNEIEMVPAPSKGIRMVTMLKVSNPSGNTTATPSIQTYVELPDPGSPQYVDVWPVTAIAAGEGYKEPERVVGLRPGYSLVGSLDVVQTNDVSWHVTWIDLA